MLLASHFPAENAGRFKAETSQSERRHLKHIFEDRLSYDSNLTKLERFVGKCRLKMAPSSVAAVNVDF